MIDLKSQFDDYAWRARILPAFLAVLSPVIVAGLPLGLDMNGVEATASAAAGLGILFLMSNIVRSLGRKKEKALMLEWGGMPTTIMLRWRFAGNSVMLAQRRQRLEALIARRLPSRNEEASDEHAADEAYEAATRQLVVKARSNKKAYPRVHEENTNYGFRRNLLALKPYGASIVVVCLAFDLVLLWSRGLELITLASVVLNLMSLMIWALVVTQKWVRDAGDAYAERLFEALDTDGAEK